MSIDVHTTFTMLDDEDESTLEANIIFDLDQSLGFCTEHLQISTAFSDYYNFYVWGGQKQAI